MQKESSDRKVYLWSISIGIGLSLITFFSNWLGLIHSGESPNMYQLFDISFYYFTPLISWVLLTFFALRYSENWIYRRESLKKKFLKLLTIVILLSPLVRVFDILADFSLKNILGLIQINPLTILNDVWLVVLFSTPAAVFKILTIIFIVYFFKRQRVRSSRLTLRTNDGAYHVIASSEIMYMQADGNYLNLTTIEGAYRMRNTLKSLEPSLGSDFYRIHKSTIVNRNFIRQLKHWRNGEYLIIMINDKPLTSSRSYKISVDEIKEVIAMQSEQVFDPTLETVRPTIA
ncbi:LytR/AlgR family response regulator transcription factor [Ekhidna sp. To15]|uniref:LytR/AlgR family response regulator transcription factor n=1 Tax=Ekhidna sp. To15 TaxID=3395267 RepID=UPI003F51EBB2